MANLQMDHVYLQNEYYCFVFNYVCLIFVSYTRYVVFNVQILKDLHRNIDSDFQLSEEEYLPPYL